MEASYLVLPAIWLSHLPSLRIDDASQVLEHRQIQVYECTVDTLSWSAERTGQLGMSILRHRRTMCSTVEGSVHEPTRFCPLCLHFVKDPFF